MHREEGSLVPPPAGGLPGACQCLTAEAQCWGHSDLQDHHLLGFPLTAFCSVTLVKAFNLPEPAVSSSTRADTEQGCRPQIHTFWPKAKLAPLAHTPTSVP